MHFVANSLASPHEPMQNKNIVPRYFETTTAALVSLLDKVVLPPPVIASGACGPVQTWSLPQQAKSTA
jgi:hypothetical protein